jgi:hypothetical protein
MGSARRIFCLVAGLWACGAATPQPKTDDVGTAGKPTRVADAALSSTPVATVEPVTEAPPPPPAPAAADDPWQAYHVMPSDDVLRTMRAAQGRVQACIKAGFQRDPSAAGEVKIQFVVTQKGAVLVWKDDESSMGDEETVTCIGDLIKTLKFPAQKAIGNSVGHYSVRTS